MFKNIKSNALRYCKIQGLTTKDYLLVPLLAVSTLRVNIFGDFPFAQYGPNAHLSTTAVDAFGIVFALFVLYSIVDMLMCMFITMAQCAFCRRK